MALSLTKLFYLQCDGEPREIYIIKKTFNRKDIL